MQSNRDAANGTLSIDTAKAKQNAIQGLWAQVTSTFTEGILKAFEKNTGYFEEQLKSLRDKLASPQTEKTIKNLFDLLIKVGEIMAKFVGYWLKLYETFPGLIKNWIVFQMAMTQLGTLMTPFIGLVSVFSRLNQIITMITGSQTVAGLTATAKAVKAVRTASTASAVASASGIATTGSVAMAAKTMRANRIANGVILAAPMLGSKTGGNLVNKRHAAYLAGQQKWEGAIMTGMAAYGLTGKSAKDPTNRTWYSKDNRIATAIANKNKYDKAVSGTSQRAGEIKKRAQSIFGAKNRFMRAFSTNQALTAASFGITLPSIIKMLVNLFVKFGAVLGLLLNPITLAIAGIGGLTIAAYQLGKKAEESAKKEIKTLNDTNANADKSRENRYAANEKLFNKYVDRKYTANAVSGGSLNNVKSIYDKNIFFQEYQDMLVKVSTQKGAEEANRIWNQTLLKHN